MMCWIKHFVTYDKSTSIQTLHRVRQLYNYKGCRNYLKL